MQHTTSTVEQRKLQIQRENQVSLYNMVKWELLTMFVHSPNKKVLFVHKGFAAMGPTSKIVGLVPFG